MCEIVHYVVKNDSTSNWRNVRDSKLVETSDKKDLQLRAKQLMVSGLETAFPVEESSILLFATRG